MIIVDNKTKNAKINITKSGKPPVDYLPNFKYEIKINALENEMNGINERLDLYVPLEETDNVLEIINQNIEQLENRANELIN